MSIFEICDPVVFLHGASASQNDAFPRAHQVERGNWDDFWGFPVLTEPRTTPHERPKMVLKEQSSWEIQ